MKNNTKNLKKNQFFLSKESPKDKPWDTHRYASDVIENMYSTSENETIAKWQHRISECAQQLTFQKNPDIDTGEIKFKLKKASFCRVRTCPVCQWRRGLKYKARLLNRLPEIQRKHPKSRWIFLTLTVKNCEIAELKSTIKKMNKGFANLKNQKKWKVLGWIKTIEVTQNDDKAHPHFHVLLHVPSYYFNGKNYIKQADWTQIWQRAMQLDYTPIVDIRTVKFDAKIDAKKGKNSFESVVSEIAKYATKPPKFDDFTISKWWIEYSLQVSGMRFIDSGGTLRGILKNEYENEELIMINDENSDEEQQKISIIYDWNRLLKHYVR